MAEGQSPETRDSSMEHCWLVIPPRKAITLAYYALSRMHGIFCAAVPLFTRANSILPPLENSEARGGYFYPLHPDETKRITSLLHYTKRKNAC